MACVSLSDLHAGWAEQSVCVRLSCLWNYRGGLENGPVKVVHMVLLDAQGNHGYATVPTDILASHINMLHEGVVYEFSRFAVLPRPIILNPVDAPLMIRFTQFIVIKNCFHLNDEFPEWTFHLTPINELPPTNDTPQNYIDVIGVITTISPVKAIRVPHTLRQVFKRCVLLSDHNGNELGITLWGERAIRFNGESVHFMGQTEPAVVIFVGATVFVNEGSKELSGGCACKWYVNHDIPDINIFRSRLPPSFPAIECLPAPSSIILQAQHADVLPTTLLTHLMNINLYHKEAGTFRCNVIITRVSHLKKWWATFCTSCHYMSMPAATSLTQPDVYTCGRHGCSSTSATIGYTLFVLAKDRSREDVELFGSKGQ
uniref:Replication protein A OB domain-containing protein n=1 Tax=Triticum urartu TaxID=4572 RepID=A0A8R7PTR1_TRIUA